MPNEGTLRDYLKKKWMLLKSIMKMISQQSENGYSISLGQSGHIYIVIGSQKAQRLRNKKTNKQAKTTTKTG